MPSATSTLARRSPPRKDRLRRALQDNRFGAAFMRGARRFGEEFDRYPFRAFGLDLPGGRLTPLPRIPAMPG